MDVFDGDKYEGWSSYVNFGGLPLTITMNTDEQRMEYLTGLFEETYIKDIIERNHIEKIQEINDLINILASGIGSLTNASKIEATFKSVIQSDISLNTIRSYIEYLKDAFIVSEANRYDVKGRKYIGTPLKYYFEDVGLRNARLGFRQTEETHIMENIIYNELRVRGFHVDVGVVMKRNRTKEGVQEKKQQEHLDKMSKDLNLSKDQVKKIKDLQDKQMADMQKNMQQREVERKANMEEMKKKQDAHAAEMKKILTPEQYQKWDADKKAKMEKRREMMKDRKGEFGKRKMIKKTADAPVVE
jgi:predicted AAA+ superfamily ATPase